MITIAPALRPVIAEAHARALAEGAVEASGGRYDSALGQLGTLAHALTYCATRADRLVLARAAARRCRSFEQARGPLATRVADGYRALAFLAFRAARWVEPAPILSTLQRAQAAARDVGERMARRGQSGELRAQQDGLAVFVVWDGASRDRADAYRLLKERLGDLDVADMPGIGVVVSERVVVALDHEQCALNEEPAPETTAECAAELDTAAE